MSTVKDESGWVGWGVFAGVIILVNGIFSVLQALVALIGPNEYYVVTHGSLFLFDVTGWGWWNLIFALLAGATWARIVAIILAILSAIGQLMLIPAQPWWSFIVIALDVWIIYVLTAHGAALRDRR